MIYFHFAPGNSKLRSLPTTGTFRYVESQICVCYTAEYVNVTKVYQHKVTIFIPYQELNHWYGILIEKQAHQCLDQVVKKLLLMSTTLMHLYFVTYTPIFQDINMSFCHNHTFKTTQVNIYIDEESAKFLDQC